MMIGSRAEGQLIKVAFGSQRVGIMRGEGWRRREEAAEVLAARRILRIFFFWNREPGQAITCGPRLAAASRTKAASVKNPRMSTVGNQSHYFPFCLRVCVCVCIFPKYSGAERGSRLSFAVGGL